MRDQTPARADIRDIERESSGLGREGSETGKQERRGEERGRRKGDARR